MSEEPQLTATGGRSIVSFIYRNHTNRIEVRRVIPLALCFGDTGPFHKRVFAWYLRGFCRDRESERIFLLDDMTAFSVVEALDYDAALVQELITRLVPSE